MRRNSVRSVNVMLEEDPLVFHSPPSLFRRRDGTWWILRTILAKKSQAKIIPPESPLSQAKRQKVTKTNNTKHYDYKAGTKPTKQQLLKSLKIKSPVACNTNKPLLLIKRSKDTPKSSKGRKTRYKIRLNKPLKKTLQNPPFEQTHPVIETNTKKIHSRNHKLPRKMLSFLVFFPSNYGKTPP